MTEYILTNTDGILISISLIGSILLSFWFGYKVRKDIEKSLRGGE